MDIIFGLLCVVLGICVLSSLFSGATITYNCKKEGQRAFNNMSLAKDADWQQEAKDKDIYYKPDPHAIIGPNACFYSDGSLRYDSTTGKDYPKGQYYCQSDGSMADWSQAPSDVKRPPKN